MPNTKSPRIIKTSHVPALAQSAGWDEAQFVKEAQYRESMARNTALKAFRGSPDISLKTAVSCMRLFGVKRFCEVLEIRQD